MLGLLVLLNLRGIKERSRCCCRFFLGFVAAHVVLIVYGIYAHLERLPELLRFTLAETHNMAASNGWMFVAATLMFAYSHGGGTYPGWRPCRTTSTRSPSRVVRTGKWTMLYMAVSFALHRGGILMLYVQWDATAAARAHAQRRRLRAHHRRLGLGSAFANHTGLLRRPRTRSRPAVRRREHRLFLGGPAVLANMAVDSWVPRQFRELSTGS